VIDTPGMRELGLWTDDVDGDAEASLADFADVAAVAERCRFSDCMHRREPGCAVQAAVEAGELAPERVASYSKLAAEQKHVGKRAEVARREAAKRSAKAGARAMREVTRRKQGDE